MTRPIWLACASAIATFAAAHAAPPGFTLSANRKIVTRDAASPSFTPPPSRRGLKAVFDNLATLDPKGVYLAGTGYAVSGTKGPVGQAWYAAAFTPAANAVVAELRLAAGYIQGRKTALSVHIYADAAGLPGQELWSHTLQLPADDGGCCAIAAVPVENDVPLLAGTQYWLGLTTVPGGADTFATWYFNVADQVDTGIAAENLGSGWFSQPLLPNVAFGVYSK